MKLSLSTVLKFIISLALGIGLVWFLNSKVSSEQRVQIIDGLKNINFSLILVSVIFAALACVIRAFRWKMLLKPMGYNPRNSTLISSIFIMYLGNLVFPRLGEVLRCSILLKEENVPLEKGIGTMITERLVDVIGLGIYFLLAIIFEYDKLKEIYTKYGTMKGETNYLIPIILFSIFVIGSIVIWKNQKLRNFVFQKISGIVEGLKSIFKLQNPILFIIYSIAIYSIYFISTYILFFAFTETSILGLGCGIVVLIAGTLGVGLTQGGIGAYQLLVTWTLELYNISTTIAQTYSWAAWIIPTATLVIFGIFSWLYIMKRSHGKGQ